MLTILKATLWNWKLDDYHVKVRIFTKLATKGYSNITKVCSIHIEGNSLSGSIMIAKVFDMKINSDRDVVMKENLS